MTALVLLVLLIIIFFDAVLLKKENKKKFLHAFECSPFTLIALSVLTVLFIMLFFREGLSLKFFYVLCVLPIYLLRRSRCRSIFETKKLELKYLPVDLLSDFLEVILWWIFLGSVCSVCIELLQKANVINFSHLEELLFMTMVSSGISLLLIYKAAQRFSSEGFLDNMKLTFEKKSFVKVFVVPAIIGLVFATLSAVIIIIRPVHPTTPFSEALSEVQSLPTFLTFIVLALCVAPLVEEIIFRGYFFHVFSKLRGKKFAVITIGLMFGMLHYNQYWGDWAAISVVTVLGLVLTFLRAQTNSTVSSIVMHYVYNGMVTVIPVIFLIISNPAYINYQVYFDEHDEATKIALLKESLLNNPKLADAYNDLAWLYAENDHDLEEGLALIDKALGFDGENDKFLDTKAEILYKLGRCNEAFLIREGVLKKDVSEESRKHQRNKISQMNLSSDFNCS